MQVHFVLLYRLRAENYDEISDSEQVDWIIQNNDRQTGGVNEEIPEISVKNESENKSKWINEVKFGIKSIAVVKRASRQ
jgi:hypothetical protein